jgi:hypothetical protein
LSVIDTEKNLLRAMDAAQEICGDFMQPDVGIMFSIQLDRVIGFNPPPENNSVS